MEKISTEWNKMGKNDQLPIILALVALICVFLPWMSFSIPSYGGFELNIPAVRTNGFHSSGMLTFLSALAFLLWKLLPLANVKIPEMKMDHDLLVKILGLVMLAGPVLWLLNAGFEFRVIGLGLWGALVASAIFVYITFMAKK